MSEFEIPTPAQIAERERAEEESKRRRREKEDHDLLIGLQRRQADANSTIADLTKALVFVGIVGLVVSFLQFRSSNESAKAAIKAANAAEQAVEVGRGQLTQSLDAADSSDVQSREAMAASQSQAQKSLQASMKAIEVSERPWISVGMSITDPLYFTPSAGGGITTNFLLRNVGRSPALHVKLHSKIVALPGKTFMNEELATAEDRECRPMRTMKGGLDDTTLFPGDPFSRDWPGNISPKEISDELKSRETGVLAHKGFVSLYLVACVDYQLSFGPQHHQTRYGFLLGIPQQFGVMGDIKPEGILTDVRLVVINQSAD